LWNQRVALSPKASSRSARPRPGRLGLPGDILGAKCHQPSAAPRADHHLRARYAHRKQPAPRTAHGVSRRARRQLGSRLPTALGAAVQSRAPSANMPVSPCLSGATLVFARTALSACLLAAACTYTEVRSDAQLAAVRDSVRSVAERLDAVEAEVHALRDARDAPGTFLRQYTDDMRRHAASLHDEHAQILAALERAAAEGREARDAARSLTAEWRAAAQTEPAAPAQARAATATRDNPADQVRALRQAEAEVQAARRDLGEVREALRPRLQRPLRDEQQERQPFQQEQQAQQEQEEQQEKREKREKREQQEQEVLERGQQEPPDHHQREHLEQPERQQRGHHEPSPRRRRELAAPQSSGQLERALARTQRGADRERDELQRQVAKLEAAAERAAREIERWERALTRERAEQQRQREHVQELIQALASARAHAANARGAPGARRKCSPSRRSVHGTSPTATREDRRSPRARPPKKLHDD
jgi:hypothetical protein